MTTSEWKLHNLIQASSKNGTITLALRFFEMAGIRLYHVLDLKICFLFDEFDETYETMPRDLFLQLRAVRDANKNRVSFGLFLRKQPDRLRPAIDNESFYNSSPETALA